MNTMKSFFLVLGFVGAVVVYYEPATGQALALPRGRLPLSGDQRFAIDARTRLEDGLHRKSDGTWRFDSGAAINSSCSPSDIRLLKFLPEVKYVVLRHECATDETLLELSQCSTIERVYIQGAGFSATGVGYLRSMPRLRDLTVCHQPTSQNSVSHHQSHQVVKPAIDHDAMQWALSIGAVALNSRLTQLSLEGNFVVDEVLASLRASWQCVGAANLEELSIKGCVSQREIGEILKTRAADRITISLPEFPQTALQSLRELGDQYNYAAEYFESVGVIVFEAAQKK